MYVGDQESRKIFMFDDITVAGTLKDVQCIQNDFRFVCFFWYQMEKTYDCSRPPRGLG